MARHSENLLCYGDNLPMLREHIADGSIDLVYLDPPFNSDASYNMLFKERDGSRAESQIKAFGDTWTWDAGAARAFDDTLAMGGAVADALRALRTLVGHSDMLAYLSMMAPRLVELRRVLKPTGSLFLHCDPTASHHLKLLLDAAFGPESFRNEIIWKRTVSHNNVRNRFGDETDTILFYSRGPRPVFNIQYRPYSEAYKESHYSQTDPDGRRFTTRDLRNPGVRPNLTYDYKGYKPHPNGWAISLKKMKEYDAKGLLHFPADKNGRIRLKRYLDEMPGTPMGTVWDDILPLNSQAQERLGYPTQKPEALLDRIILATTNRGDVVLDPFCGCGTAVASAQRLDRRWVGIDITALAINLIEQRLVAAHGSDIKRAYRTEGEPSSAADAVHLAQNPHAFQAWVMRKLKAEPGPRGADRGIDGRKWFRDAGSKKDQAIIISVKAGGISPSHLRDLRGVLEREEAAIGVLVCRNEPTREMRRETATSGFVETAWGKHARLQILTIDDIFAGKVIDCPPSGAEVTFKKAPRAKRILAEPRELFADPLVGTALSRNRAVAAEPPAPRYGVSRKPTIKAAARVATPARSRKPRS